jgi:general secretion pathway protein M
MLLYALRDGTMKLARREKYFVFGAVLSIAAFLLLEFLVFPSFEAMKRVQRGVEAKENALKEITRLSSEYQRYRRGSQDLQQALARRKGGFTLFSFLEKAAGDVGIKEYIKYMKPSTSTGPGPYKELLVEMKLEAIALSQLVDYLYKIEAPENLVTVKRISIKETKGKSGYLDTILQVMTFQ